MGVQSRWEKYPATYRANEMQRLAEWIADGESGAVVGLPGTGRSTVLNIICRRPELLLKNFGEGQRTAVLVPVDLNNLPDVDLATLYRVILRSFYEIRERFEEPIQKVVKKLYKKHKASRDPFLSQSGLLNLLLRFEEEETKVVLVMNRFDSFCQNAAPEMTRTLRGLRDRFKETLCYIMGMDQEVAYFSYLDSVEPLYNILDTHVLWVGPLNSSDAKDMVERELKVKVDDTTKDILYSLTGGYPSLIRVVCHWWSEMADNRRELEEKLLERKNVQHRLSAIFNALTQEEQVVLRDVANSWSNKGNKLLAEPSEYECSVLTSLAKKGICTETKKGWIVFSKLMERFPSQAQGQSLGLIRLKEETSEIFQGAEPITNLTPLERKILMLFLQNPRYLYSYSELAGAWIEEESNVVQGVSNEAIQQMISGLRKKIEPYNSKPTYIISWRGTPEGGYQFFPEGRPN